MLSGRGRVREVVTAECKFPWPVKLYRLPTDSSRESAVACRAAIDRKDFKIMIHRMVVSTDHDLMRLRDPLTTYRPISLGNPCATCKSSSTAGLQCFATREASGSQLGTQQTPVEILPLYEMTPM